MNLNKQFQVVAKELGVGLLKCGMILEILPLYEDGHRKVKCRKCTNILTADKANGTRNLHRNAKKCHQENDSVSYQPPLDQDMYHEKIAMAIISIITHFHLRSMRLIESFVSF